MDIGYKIKKIREGKGLTQEKFAKELYVSRTAVSKWELNKGYPSIDSLKLIAEKFNVSLSDLLTNCDLIDLAEKDIIQNKRKTKNYVITILDLFTILILFLPLFSQKIYDRYVCLSLFNCVEISKLNFIIFICFVGLTFICGILEFINIKIENFVFSKILLYLSFIFSIISIVMFILCRQIYVSIFELGFLVIKGFFLIKNKE